MKAKKTKYLSYIEDTRKHHSILGDIASEATKKAIVNAHKKNIPVTYLEGENIVRVDSKGKKEVIDTIKNNRRKVKVGSKSNLHKK